jgi:hypothetical protein
MKLAKKIFIVVFVLFVFPLLDCNAAMRSNNYKINADSIDTGGSLSSSANFKMGDTLGEVVTGEGASASYRMKAGYQYMINSYLSLAVDFSSVDLGSLIPGSPVTGQTLLTVSTDSWGGYTLNVSKDQPMTLVAGAETIPDHNGTIATPLAWQAPDNLGFGFTIISGTGVDTVKWGSGPYNYAAFPDLATTVHAKTGFSSAADNTIIGYKADVDNDQGGGAYACTITYTAVAAL